MGAVWNRLGALLEASQNDGGRFVHRKTVGTSVSNFDCPLGGKQNIRGDGLFAMNPFAHFRHSKNKNSMALFAVAIMAIGFGASGCAKLKARDDLNKGVAAYRDGKYDQAIEFFKDAKDNDPTLTNAR